MENAETVEFGLVNLSETVFIGNDKKRIEQIDNNKTQFTRELIKELAETGG